MRVRTENVESLARREEAACRATVDEGEIVEITRLGELRAFAEPWKLALLKRNPRCPTHLAAWAEATLAAVTPFRPFRVLLGVGPQGLELILPLTLRRQRLFGYMTTGLEAATELSPFYCQNPEYWLPRLFGWLDRAYPNWSRIEFAMVRHADPLAMEIERSAPQLGLAHSFELTHLSPHLKIAGDYDSYLRERRDKLSGVLRNKRAKLVTLGRLEEICLSAPEDAPKAVAAMLEIEQESWKYGRRSDMTSREQQHVFYHHLCEGLARDGQLSLNLLRLSGEPIAYELDILLDGHVYSLKHSYKERFKKFSPGVILRAYSLREYFERGFDSVDFWGSADRFKHLWTDQDAAHYRLTVFRSDRLGVCARLASTWRRRLDSNRLWLVLNDFFVGPVKRKKMKNPPPGHVSRWLRSLRHRQTVGRNFWPAKALSSTPADPPPNMILSSPSPDAPLPQPIGAAFALWPCAGEDFTPSCLAVSDGVAVAGIIARREAAGIVVLGCYIDPAFRSLQLIAALRHSFLSTHRDQQLYFEQGSNLPDYLSFDLIDASSPPLKPGSAKRRSR